MINLLLTLDKNYINPLCAMLSSLTKSNGGESFAVYVAHSSLDESDFDKIKSAVAGFDFTVKPIRLDDDLFADAPTKKRISKETYYRVFAPLYLPQSVHRILYIDPDTVVINPLKNFYNTPFNGNALIGAKHFDGLMDLWNRKRLFMKKSPRYINAGIMLMNLDEMRKGFDKEKVFGIIRQKTPVLFLADQDLINILYDGKIGYESEYLINLDERCCKRLPQDSALKIVRATAVIVHFNGKYKPWKPNYKGVLSGLWFEFGSKKEKAVRLKKGERAA